MNCFTFTVTKRQLKKIRKDGILRIPGFLTQTLPAEGDRIYLNNFEDVFVVSNVEKVDGTLEDEAQQPYFLGHFELTLHRLYSNFETVSVRCAYQSGDYHESGFIANEAADLYAKFEAELALNEAKSEGALKVSREDRERIIAKAEWEADNNFRTGIYPAIFSPSGCYQVGPRCIFKVTYDAVMAYLDEYEAVALMLFYHEHNLDENEVYEYIPVAYVDMDVAEQYGLTTDDIQHIVEELFFETMIDFDPETAVAVMENPTIVIPEDQVDFYNGLIEGNGWLADSEATFGYKVFN